MAEPVTAERVPSPSLYVSIRSFLGSLLATLCTRFDLVTVELEEQAIFALRLVLFGITALMFAGMSLFFLMLLIVAIFWDYKVLVLSIILGVNVIGLVTFALLASALLGKRPKILEQTMAEFRKDVDALRKPVGPSMVDHTS